MKAAFEVKRAIDGRFVFNLKAPNEQVIFTSQSYESKEGALAGIASVKPWPAPSRRYA